MEYPKHTITTSILGYSKIYKFQMDFCVFFVASMRNFGALRVERENASPGVYVYARENENAKTAQVPHMHASSRLRHACGKDNKTYLAVDSVTRKRKKCLQNCRNMAGRSA